MPYDIPAYIFDIDEATAERLALLNIRRRFRRRLTGFLAALGTMATAAIAVAM